MNYLKKHLAGEFSLPHAYWLNSVLLSNIAYAIVCGLFGLLLGALGVSAEFMESKAIEVFSLLFAIPFLWWSVEGTWKSADNWIAAHPGVKFWNWGKVAKFCLALGVLRVFVGLFLAFIGQ